MAIPDPLALSDEDLDLELERLLTEERQLSVRRTAIHERLSFLGPGHQQVAELREQERAVSDERRALHYSIDVLRAERTRRGFA